MTWVCSNVKCKRITKGFANGRTLCWVCVQCENRYNKKVKENEEIIKE